MITLENVSFRYKKGETPALNNLNLHIGRGEFVGIIGTSGAGKTTFTYLLNGSVPHFFAGDFYGSVKLDGKDTVENSPAAFCRTVGEVFQDIDSQMVASNVEDEILFGMENFGVAHDEIGRRMDAVLEELGITELKHREISSLSGGQKQKVAIASILALEPELIVLDEPTGELDPESSRDIFRTLRRLNREKGMTVVVVEQKIMLLCEFVDRLLVMDKGSVVVDGTPRQVVADIAKFKSLGINVPRVAELAGCLKEKKMYEGPIPLDVDEGEKMVREVLHRG